MSEMTDVIKIPLTQGKHALVDRDDHERVSQYKWYAHKRKTGVYATRCKKRVGGKQHQMHMHNYIMNPPTGKLVDHINGDGLDNRRCNLRFCTHAQNIINSRPRIDRESKYRGVNQDKRCGSWRAYITVDKKRIYLGSFHSEEDAAKVRDRAAIKYHGEFAQLNFKEGESYG